LQCWLLVVSSWKRELSHNHSAASKCYKKESGLKLERFFQYLLREGSSRSVRCTGEAAAKKKICNGGECERKHEVVNQSKKEQNFQGAGNTILRRRFLEKKKKILSLEMDRKRTR